MARDERPAAGWAKEEMRIDDGAGDPFPPPNRPGEADEPAVSEDILAADAEGDVLAAHVETASGASQEHEPGWNKDEMRFDDRGDAEGADDARHRDPDTMLESESGPTGGRSNPGGGERFGEIDDGASEERR